MSPEQALGQNINERSDVYSLGIVLYELVVGRRPFPISNLQEAIRHHSSRTEAPAPRSVHPQLPEIAERALLKALQKEPSERFGSAGELAEAIAYLEAQVP